MPRRATIWPLLATCLLLGACGPTEKESGQAMLVMAPVITLVGLGLAAVFQRLWSPLADEPELHLRPSWRVMALLVSCTVPLLFDEQLEDDWIIAALWMGGTTYLTFFLIGLRLCIVSSLRRYYSAQVYLPWLLLYPPALYLAYFGSNEQELGAFPGLLWTMPGYLGLVSGPIFLIMLLEIVVRRHRHAKRRAAEALPRPLPPARASIRK
jgi:hypothetical protein